MAVGSPQEDWLKRRVILSGYVVRGLALVALCGILFGRTTEAAAQDQSPVKSLLEFRTQNVTVQKYDLSCGAAALATVLNFQFGDPVTEKEITHGLIQRKEYIENPEVVRVREGFSLLDLKRYVDKRGYRGVGYGNLELKDLLKLAPIIVAVSPIGYNHFVIFRGVLGDEVLIADPAFGNETMSLEKFQRIWIDFPKLGRVGFIVTRDGHPAPPGQLALNPSQFVLPPNSFVRQAELPF